ncbi:hypothetical protein HK100_008611 [Physocladia obscura]|uniref:AB hydrolase-1 domain-containing protein n=1 Tax=Physocladia obscura TaxID=109957 RepID=A0AAD5T4J5_9FUNG|nr:hypothetical protein HK100_008611 [Physocladia obscura]
MAAEEDCQEVAFITSNGITVAGKKYYSPGEPCTDIDEELRILAIHGWLDNANSYNEFASRFLKFSGRPTIFIAIDLPGHGKSGHVARAVSSYFLWDFALAVLDISISLRWERFVLLGHSMGGHVAALFAGVYPEKLKSLVLFESVGHINRLNVPGDDAASMRKFIDRRRTVNLEESSITENSKTSIRNVYESVEAAARVRMEGATRVSFEAAMALCERGLTNDSQNKWTWTTDKRLLMRHFFQWDHIGIENIMSSIECKVLLILGCDSAILKQQDPLVNNRIAVLRNRRKKDQDKGGFIETRVQWISKGTHHLHLEHDTVDVVVDNVFDFVTGLK